MGRLGSVDDNWGGENPTASLTKVKPDPRKPATCFIPLDGDPATNENDAWVIDWSPLRRQVLAARKLSYSCPDLTKPASATNQPLRHASVQPNPRRGLGRGAAGAFDYRDARLARSANGRSQMPIHRATMMNCMAPTRTTCRCGHGSAAAAQGVAVRRALQSVVARRAIPGRALYALAITTTQPYKPQNSGVDLSAKQLGRVRRHRLIRRGDAIPVWASAPPGALDNATFIAPPRMACDRGRRLAAGAQPGSGENWRGRIANRWQYDRQMGAPHFAGHSQRLGDTLPDVKLNLPDGAPVDPLWHYPTWRRRSLPLKLGTQREAAAVSCARSGLRRGV